MNSKASLLATALLSAAAITSLGVPSSRAMPLDFNKPDQANTAYSKVFDDWIGHSMSSVPFGEATGGSLDRTQTSGRDNTCSWLPLSYRCSLQRKAMLPSNRADEASVLGPLAACFDADNPPPTNIIAAVELAEQRGLGTNRPLYHLLRRWPGLQGAPITLRWSFVPDALVIPPAPVGAGQPVWDNGGAAAPSQLFSSLDGQFGNRALWISLFQSVFDRWQALTGITFVRVQNGLNDWDDGSPWGAVGSATCGDIRISLRNIDGLNGILAYCYYPTTGGMVLDSSENWAFGPVNNYLRMRNIIAHELGHGIGLQHTCPFNQTKLMEPFITSAPLFAGPQQDDVRGGEQLYGDPYEPNNSAPGFDLGVLTGSITVGGLPAPPLPDPQIANASIASIDANGEADWFQITVPAPTLLTATLQPVGSTYDDSAQDINGSCLSGSLINALAVGDLTLEVLNSSSVSLAFANATGAGGSETINNLLLPTAAIYYVKVAEANAPAQAQLYKLILTANTPCLAITNQSVVCIATNNTYAWSFCVTNDFNGPIGYLSFPDLPVGVMIDRDILPLNPVLQQGDGTCVTLYLTNTLGTNNLCFTIGAHSTNFFQCCSITNCITFPPCCVSLSSETLVGTNNCYSYTFTIQNDLPIPINNLFLVQDPAPPPTCVTFTPDIITFSPPLGPGQSSVVTVKVCTAAGCKGCFLVAAVGSNTWCSIPHCLPAVSGAVQSLVSSLKCVDNALHFCLPTTAGATYYVESTTSLSPPLWTVQQTIVGDGSMVTVTNAINATPQQFYRVRVE